MEKAWPQLQLNQWRNTYNYVHMLTQIVGKIQLEKSPYINHWWHVAFHLNTRGFTSGLIPDAKLCFEFQFDFIDHHLHILTSNGHKKSIPLEGYCVADFYNALVELLDSLHIATRIWAVPVEVENPVPFSKMTAPVHYDRDAVANLWTILVQSGIVFQNFRSGFTGKCSPLHFFWGGFDLALTRFSGRKAPQHPPVPNVSQGVVTEAYSHEVSSCGFWPGGALVQEPAYYAYCYPEPAEMKYFPVRPDGAYYHSAMGEFILPYDIVRNALDPQKELSEFLQSTYEAAAITGHWDRKNLESQRSL